MNPSECKIINTKVNDKSETRTLRKKYLVFMTIIA